MPVCSYQFVTLAAAARDLTCNGQGCIVLATSGDIFGRLLIGRMRMLL